MIERKLSNTPNDLLLLGATEAWLSVQTQEDIGATVRTGEIEAVTRYNDGSVRVTIHLQPSKQVFVSRSSAQPAAREKTGAPLADLGMEDGFAKKQRNAGTRKPSPNRNNHRK